MSTAKTGLNWSRTVERYVPRSSPLCPMLATVMSTAREKTTEGIPIWSLVIIWIISLTIFRKEKNMASSRYARQTEDEMERLFSEKNSKNTNEQFQLLLNVSGTICKLMALIRNLNRSKLVFLTVG